MRKSASISLVGFLPSEILPSVTIVCTQKKHCVDVLHSSERSPAPNRNSSCGIHPHMSLELPSPVQGSTLQARHSRISDSPAHNTQLRRSAITYLSFAARADRTVTQHQHTTRNTLPSSDTACMVCITRGFDSCNTFLPLEQPNQPRTHSEKTSQSLQSHFIQVRRLHLACQIHGTRSVHQVCHWRYCARIVFARYKSDASLSIGTSPSMSVSLSLTPAGCTPGG